jgi:hypothetical protein
MSAEASPLLPKPGWEVQQTNRKIFENGLKNEDRINQEVWSRWGCWRQPRRGCRRCPMASRWARPVAIVGSATFRADTMKLELPVTGEDEGHSVPWMLMPNTKAVEKDVKLCACAGDSLRLHHCRGKDSLQRSSFMAARGDWVWQSQRGRRFWEVEAI